MMDSFFIFGAKYLFIISPIVALFVFWKTPRDLKKQLILVAVISVIAAYALSYAAGMIYSHPQPFAAEHFTPLVPHEVDNSFPSHHTLFAAVIAGVIYFYNRRAGLWLWLFAIVVGLSRIYVGLHYFSDVITSLLIGVVVTAIAYHLLKTKKSAVQE
jgi:undecaprenyl-diphosphatase